MISAVLLVAGLAGILGAFLIWLDGRVEKPEDRIVDVVHELLPRMQCGQCGYPGCRPYAEAIVADQADINRCPPGGEATISRLAALLHRDRKPLEVSRGSASWARVAFVDEAACIGCGLCLRACPVDAIIGAANWMHTVLAEQCTGCELCVAPCPVDCIDMIPRHAPLSPRVAQHA